MPRMLSNYTDVPVPDLTDPQPTASGQIAGAPGGNDFAQVFDDHDHDGAGNGLPAKVIITEDLDMGGFDIANVAVVKHVTSPIGEFGPRSVGFQSDDLVVMTGSGDLEPVSGNPVVFGLTAGTDYVGGPTTAATSGGLPTDDLVFRSITTVSTQYAVDLQVSAGIWLRSFGVTAERLAGGAGSDDFEMRLIEVSDGGVTTTLLATILGSAYAAGPSSPSFEAVVLAPAQILTDKWYRVSVVTGAGFAGGIRVFGGEIG